MGIPAGRRTQKKKPNPTTRKHDRIGCYFIIILIRYSFSSYSFALR